MRAVGGAGRVAVVPTKKDEQKVYAIGDQSMLEAEARLVEHMQGQARVDVINAEIARLTAAVPHELVDYDEEDELVARLRAAPEKVRAQFKELRRLTRELNDINRALVGDGPYKWPPSAVDDELG